MKEAEILQFQDTSNVIGSSLRTLRKTNILKRHSKDKCIHVMQAVFKLMQAVFKHTLLHNCAIQKL